jgi:hypothetical protein
MEDILREEKRSEYVCEGGREGEREERKGNEYEEENWM